MVFEFEVDFDKLCKGGHALSFDEKFWPELRNKYANEELILARRATLVIDDKKYPLSSINEESFLDELNDILSNYCKSDGNQISQKIVYVEFKYVIPLKITLKPKNKEICKNKLKK